MTNPSFRLSIGPQFVRYTDDISPNRPPHIRYALTFDEEDSEGNVNPIADFRAVDRKLRVENADGLFVSGVSWSQAGELFNAVLVPGTHSFNRAEIEMIDGEESGTVRVRDLNDAGIQQIYYLGGGQRDETCCCPVSGLVKHVIRNDDGTAGHYLSWCTHFDLTLHANSSSDRAAIRDALSPMHCETDAQCHEWYDTLAVSCEQNQCVHPEQVDCQWEWTDWDPDPCEPDDIQTRTVNIIQDELHGGLCPAPPEGTVEERHCPSFFDTPGNGDGNGNGDDDDDDNDESDTDRILAWLRDNWLTLVAIGIGGFAIFLLLIQRGRL